MLRKLTLPMLPVLFLTATPALAADFDLLPAPDAEERWGYVSAADGSTVIAPKYARTHLFYHGFAVVHQEYREQIYTVYTLGGESIEVIPQGDGIIDKSGNEVLAPKDGQFVSPAVPEDQKMLVLPLVLPALHVVQNFNERGVFSTSEGWLLPLGKDHNNIRFMADGSFYYNGNSYISFGPKREHFSAPDGYAIAGVDAATKTFLLKDKVRAKASEYDYNPGGHMAVARWTGELVSPKEYHDIRFRAACGRWLGFTKSGGMDIFDSSGKILRGFASEQFPTTYKGEINYGPLGGQRYIIDPCTLETRVAHDMRYSPDKEPEQEHKLVRQANMLWGLYSADGRELIAPRYEILKHAGDKYWWGRYAETKWVLIDQENGMEIRIK